MLSEVFERVLQQRDEGHALQAVAVMQQGAVVDMDARLALVAARISLERRLPMADSVILAPARTYVRGNGVDTERGFQGPARCPVSEAQALRSGRGNARMNPPVARRRGPVGMKRRGRENRISRGEADRIEGGSRRPIFRAVERNYGISES